MPDDHVDQFKGQGTARDPSQSQFIDQRSGQERRHGERRQQWRRDPALVHLAILDDLSAMLTGWLAHDPPAPERARQLQALITKHQEY
jgi:hypothetical protein